MTKVLISFMMILSIGLSQSQPNLHYDDGKHIADSIQNNAFKKSQIAKDTTLVRIDSTHLFKKENTSHSLNFQLFGPYFLSSMGYAWENQVYEKLSLQLDFRVAGHYGGYYGRSWSIGPSLSQSVLFGKRFKMKLGFSEGIVFNPPSIKGVFVDFQSHDRPPRSVFFFSFNTGCEIKLNKTFFVIPEGHLAYLSLMKMQGELQSEQKIRISGIAPSFGITLKIKV